MSKEVAIGYPSIQEIKANPVPDRNGKNGSRDLSLDLGVSCVGWAFGYDKRVVRHGKFVFKRNKKTGIKLAEFENFLRVLIRTYKPTRLIVEAPSRRRGHTTARHFEQLGVIRLVWFQETGQEISKSWLISARQIKKLLRVETTGNHDRNKKIMVDFINKKFNLGLHYNISSPKDRQTNDDDIADAIAVLLAYWIMLSKK